MAITATTPRAENETSEIDTDMAGKAGGS